MSKKSRGGGSLQEQLKKAGLVAALRAAGIHWREDRSNARGDFFRNRVRHDVLPAWMAAAVVTVAGLLAPAAPRAQGLDEVVVQARDALRRRDRVALAEAARTLGEMWEADDCSFYDVTLGTGRIQRLIREFSHQFWCGSGK